MISALLASLKWSRTKTKLRMAYGPTFCHAIINEYWLNIDWDWLTKVKHVQQSYRRAVPELKNSSTLHQQRASSISTEKYGIDFVWLALLCPPYGWSAYSDADVLPSVCPCVPFFIVSCSLDGDMRTSSFQMHLLGGSTVGYACIQILSAWVISLCPWYLFFLASVFLWWMKKDKTMISKYRLKPVAWSYLSSLITKILKLKNKYHGQSDMTHADSICFFRCLTVHTNGWLTGRTSGP